MKVLGFFKGCIVITWQVSINFSPSKLQDTDKPSETEVVVLFAQ